MEVTSNNFVKMHFKFRLRDGSIAENTENYNRPFIFQMGKNCFTDKVEYELLGATIDENKRILLMPQEAFGEKDHSIIHSVPKYKFPKDIKLEEGLIVSFSQKDNSKIPGLITKISESNVIVDFNHPLSGQIIIFEAKILDIADKEYKLN